MVVGRSSHLLRLSAVCVLLLSCVAVSDAARVARVAAAPAVLDGSWVIRSSASIVGFRAREKYLSLSVPSEVVGRTSVVQGMMKILKGKIVSTTVTVDMRTLKTDDPRRDETLRTTRGPQWDRYPHGTFKLTLPISLGGLRRGSVRTLVAIGDLRLHTVSRTVRFPLEVRW